MARVNAHELSVLCKQLATLIKAGIPLLQGLSLLSEQSENKTMTHALGQVRAALTNGASLGEALGERPDVFPVLFVNMVKSGEIGGALEYVFEQLGQNMQREWEFAAKIKSAMLYPLLVVLIALTSALVMLVFVVPQFVLILNSLAAPLPLTTRFLIGLSNGLRVYWYLVPCGVAAAIFIGRKLLFSAGGRRHAARLSLKIPLWGKLVQKLIMMRFCRSLSALLQAGVPILQALEVVRGLIGNHLVTESIRSVEESIKEGGGLAAPLGRGGVFPPLVVQMIAVGEETGAVDQLLEQVAAFYEQEAGETAARLSALVEPALIIGVGGFVAFIVLSVMLPVLTIINYIE